MALPPPVSFEGTSPPDFQVPPTYHDEQVGVGAGEDRDVHGHAHGVGLVQPHPEVPLPAQKQQDEDTDVHQAHPSCGAGRGRVTSLGGAARKGVQGRDPSWGGGGGEALPRRSEHRARAARGQERLAAAAPRRGAPHRDPEPTPALH